MMGEVNVHRVILDDVNAEDWKVSGTLNRANKVFTADMPDMGLEALEKFCVGFLSWKREKPLSSGVISKELAVPNRVFTNQELRDMGVPYNLALPYQNRTPGQAILYIRELLKETPVSYHCRLVFSPPNQLESYEITYTENKKDFGFDPFAGRTKIEGRHVRFQVQLTTLCVPYGEDVLPPVIPQDVLESALHSVLPPEGADIDTRCAEAAQKMSPALDEAIYEHLNFVQDTPRPPDNPSPWSSGVRYVDTF